jgi:Carboxypeptidase regulatory-like domain
MRFRLYFVLLLLGSVASLAQTQSAASSRGVTGDVQDTSGAVIVGAQVTLTTQDARIVTQGTTDSSGAFRFLNISAGNYTVDVTQTGFQEVRQQIKVGSGTRPQVHFVLRVASVSQDVTVAASDSSAQVSTEISQNQDSNTVDRDALDRLPVFDQDYITTMSRFLDSDATGTNGITLVVNGIEANGPGVTASAIQSVKINQNPYTALYSRPGRARIEITTKGGTPQFHGSANFLYRDSLFDARNAFAVTKPSEQRTYYEGSLTGPLSHSKKTTFLLALDKDNDNQESIVVAAGPSGAINANVPLPIRHYFLSGRVFHDYTQGNQFWMGYSYEHKTVQNQGVGGIVLPEAGTNTLFFEHEVNVGHVYVFSPKLLNQLHFLVGHFDNQIHSLNENPQLIVQGAFTGGGAQADFRRTEYHFDGTDIVTYSTRRQEIKFGIDVPDISRRGFDDFTNQAGTYSFAGLATYEASNPFSYLVQSGQGHVTFLEKTVAGIFEDNIRLRSNLSVALGIRYYWQNYFHDIAHDLAPRLSFAYAPSAKGKTVIRGGGGFFFDRTGPSPISDLLHFNGVRLKRFILENPSYPVTESELANVPTSVVVLDPRQRIPYTIQYGGGIEQQLNASSSLSVSYLGSTGIDLFRSVDVNAPPPPDYIARPNSNLGQERQLQSEGRQRSNAFQVGFRGRPVSYFVGQAQYTLGKTYNNTSGITYFPANSYFPQSDWARSDNDQRNKFDLLGTLEAGKWFNFGTALSLYSGKPVNITTGTDNNHDSLPLDRPAGIPRNFLHGPTYINLDFNLAHDILLTKAGKEGPMATISINSFNVLNHENDVTYVGVVTSPFYGHAVAAQPPRRMQLDLEFKF